MKKEYLKDTIDFECPSPDNTQLIINEKMAEEIIKSDLGTFTLFEKEKRKNKNIDMKLPAVNSISDFDKFYKKNEQNIENALISGAFQGTGSLSFEDVFYGISSEEMSNKKKNSFIHEILKQNFLAKKSISVKEFINRLQNLSLPIKLYNHILWQLFDISDQYERDLSVNFLEPDDNPRHLDKNLIFNEDNSMNISSMVYRTEDAVVIKILYYRETPGIDYDCYNPFIEEVISFPVGYLKDLGKREYIIETNNELFTGKNRKELIDKVKTTGKKIREIYLDKVPVAENCY